MAGGPWTVTQNLTLHYDRMMLMLDPTPLGARVGAQEGRDRQLPGWPVRRFSSDGTALGFRVFDKIRTVDPGTIVDNKRLSAVLEQVKTQQAAYAPNRQRRHVARQRPPNNLEAPGLPSKGRTAWHCRCGAGLNPRQPHRG